MQTNGAYISYSNIIHFVTENCLSTYPNCVFKKIVHMKLNSRLLFTIYTLTLILRLKLDFARAFDKLPHRRLIPKLS